MREGRASCVLGTQAGLSKPVPSSHPCSPARVTLRGLGTREKLSPVLCNGSARPLSADALMCSGGPSSPSGVPGTARPASIVPSGLREWPERPARLSLASAQRGARPAPQTTGCFWAGDRGAQYLREATPGTGALGSPPSEGFPEPLPNCRRRGRDLCDVRVEKQPHPDSGAFWPHPSSQRHRPGTSEL